MLSRLPSPHCRGWHTRKGRGAREESREVSDPRTCVSTYVVVSVPKPCSQVRGVKREAQTRNHNAETPVHTAPTQTQARAGIASHAAHSHLPGDPPLLCVRCRRVQLCIGKLELGRRSILRPHAQGRRPPNLTKDSGESRIPSDVPWTPQNARFHATHGGHHTPWDKRCAGSSEARET